MTLVPDAESLWRIYGQGLVLVTLVGEAAEVSLEPGFAVGLCGEPHPELNYAVVGNAVGAEDRLREYAALLRTRGFGGYVNLSAGVAARLEPVALELGLELEVVTPLMVRQPGPTQGRDGRYVVDRVDDAAGRRAAAYVTAEAFEAPFDQLDRAMGVAARSLPGVDYFVAYEEEVPVSCAVTTRIGPYVGFWDMATLPSRRRRGAGTATLEFAIDFHAPEVGLYFLTASDSGRALYESCGFTVVEMSPCWLVTQPSPGLQPPGSSGRR